jgi:hypothetical protein
MKRIRIAVRALVVVLLCSAGHIRGQQTVFLDNFDGGRFLAPTVSGGFSGYTHTEPSQGFSGLGNPGNAVSGSFLHNPTGDNFTNTPVQKTTLSLSGLPPHTGIQLRFLLAIIDTWDGNTGDFFHVDVDGVARFAETFTNFTSGSQSYVAPSGVLIQRGPNVGFEGFGDGLYDLGRDTAHFGFIPHTGSTLEIDFYAGGPGWNRPANESWAIDNVAVALWVIPEPATASIFGLALVGAGGVRRQPRGNSGPHRQNPCRLRRFSHYLTP